MPMEIGISFSCPKKKRSGSACSARHQDRSALSQKRIVDFASLSSQPQLNAWGFKLTWPRPSADECSLNDLSSSAFGHATPAVMPGTDPAPPLMQAKKE